MIVQRLLWVLPQLLSKRVIVDESVNHSSECVHDAFSGLKSRKLAKGVNDLQTSLTIGRLGRIWLDPGVFICLPVVKEECFSPVIEPLIFPGQI
jgi:hypothetical protein